jgi:hypothetical protein
MRINEIKEFDILSIQRKAAVITAKILKIDYCDLMDYSELHDMIKERDENLFNKLNDFSNAYWNYYYYVKGINSMGKNYQINEKEQAILNTHLKEKDDSRSILLMEIEKKKNL